jgi:hypothetical protein
MEEKTTKKTSKKSTEGRRPPIPSDVKTKLWLKSGGRCEYRNCNEPLYEDSLTFKKLNKSLIAHIYGYAEASARYDADLSPKLAADFSNLMLLCHGCHKKIDDEQRESHDAPLLIKMKKEHEDRIEHMTSLKEKFRTNVVFYNARIGSINPPMEFDAVQYMLAKSNVYPAKEPIILSPENSIVDDGDTAFYEYQAKSLEAFFQKNVEPHQRTTGLQHFSVFPFAPMPLLIRLGTLFGDKYDVRTYQLQREPREWGWYKTPDTFTGFKLIPPSSTSGIPVLNISLSANIDNARVKAVLPDEEISIWTLTVDAPQLDLIKSEEMLDKWRQIAREAFARIKDVHGHHALLRIFPAMPLSASVEFGRVWMPKVDLPMVIYDGRDNFKETLTINRQ